MKNMNNEWIFVLSFGIVILLLVGVSYNALIATSSEERDKILLYYVSTRDPQKIPYEIIGPVGYHNEIFRNFSGLTCQTETLVIFVHGWEESEDEVNERLNRMKLSLENNSFIHPLIGFSWPSNTNWPDARSKLADLIFYVKNEYPNTDIRLLAHSLGARVVLSSLDTLYKNQTWNSNNFTIKSVDLLGTAVDDEEVSTNPMDILNDPTNLGSPKSDYGQAIAAVVIDFTNSFSSKDNLLEPNPKRPYPPFQIYPSFETDRALGQRGYQKNPHFPIYDIKKSLPKNYTEIDVQDQLRLNLDADGDGECDFRILGTNICMISEIGDNHRGYLGYRKPVNNLTIIDDGAIDIVVDRWNNRT